MSDNLYRQHWDYYAQNMKLDGEKWLGDEWGTEEGWDGLFKQMFLAQGAAEWERAVEIGAGSGKYTIRLLRASPAHVLAADISAGYQSHFIKRLTEEKLIDRTTPYVIDRDSGGIAKQIADKGWFGKLDALYSIDAMVHVDLQYVFVYWLTAAAALKPGGKLVMTLANVCSEGGFQKLVKDSRQMFARMGEHTAKFEWMSPEIVATILPRLNFRIDLLNTTARDILLVATLEKPIDDPALLKVIGR